MAIMPIPPFTLKGELPPGIHIADIDEIEACFGLKTERRRKLMAGLKEALKLLKQGKVSKVYIDGSFVSSKEEPNDVDGCWSSINADATKLDARFWDFSDESDFQLKRSSLRQEFGIDFFIAELIEGHSGEAFPAFIQSNRDGLTKGIILVNL